VSLKALKAEHGVIVGKHDEFEPTQYIVKVPDYRLSLTA
jgi:hypothetical protein